jgi:hypothetical protein
MKRPGRKIAVHVRLTRDTAAAGWESYCSYFTHQLALTRTKPSPTPDKRPSSIQKHVYFTPLPYVCLVIRASCDGKAFET